MRGPLDRPGDQMRKETDEERIVDERAGRLEAPKVHVDDVGQGLERVERNPRGEEDPKGRMRNLDSDCVHQTGERVDEEIEVLEDSEESEIERHREGQRGLAFEGVLRAIDDMGAVVVDDARQENQPAKAPVTPRVEKVAGKEEEDVLRAPRHPPVQDD